MLFTSGEYALYMGMGRADKKLIRLEMAIHKGEWHTTASWSIAIG